MVKNEARLLRELTEFFSRAIELALVHSQFSIGDPPLQHDFLAAKAAQQEGPSSNTQGIRTRRFTSQRVHLDSLVAPRSVFRQLRSEVGWVLVPLRTIRKSSFTIPKAIEKATNFFKKAMRMPWDYWNWHTHQSHGLENPASRCT